MNYLIRPGVAVVVLSAVVGTVSLVARRFDLVVAAVLTVVVIFPLSPATALVLLIGAVIGLVVRIWGLAGNQRNVVLAMSVVFFLTSLVRVVPSLSEQSPALAATRPEGEVPVYLVLLDGYPRDDTLKGLGIDNSAFISELEDRGFDYYPDAYSDFAWTHLTLTNMLAGGYEGPDEWGEPAVRGDLRKSWKLPNGFVSVAPPSEILTIPGVPVLNPGGPSVFEEDLLRHSALAYLPGVGDFVMDGLRWQLDRALEAIVNTDEERVFAHLLAPHTPFLYDAAGNPLPIPSCWPDCHIFDIYLDRLDMTLDEWIAGLEGNVSHLNGRVLETIDEVIDTHPDAVMVLFSDHGGRFDSSDKTEWHRTFLAARTPGQPMLFRDDPRPGTIIERVIHD